MTASLYLRLGRKQDIAALVDDVVDRHAANPLLAPGMRCRDLPQLKALSLGFFSARAGGTPPDKSSGKQLAHAGTQFGGRELEVVIADVAATMQEQGLAATEIRDVVALLRAPNRAAEVGNVRGTQAA